MKRPLLSTLSTLAVTSLHLAALVVSPAQAQSVRVFVAAQGSDSNGCTFAAPCRTFQHAHDTVAAGGEIDVLDPAGYGVLTITKAISIQGHGFAGIAAPSPNNPAITVSAGASDNISLRGLLIDGVGTGSFGIVFQGGGSLDVQDCLIRNFSFDGLSFDASGALFLSNTYIAANGASGISLPIGPAHVMGVFDQLTVEANGGAGMNVSGTTRLTVGDSVISNNGTKGVEVSGSSQVVLQNVIVANHNQEALYAAGAAAVIRFTKSTITGNTTTFATPGSGQIWSYGDNIIDGNTNNFLPSTTPLN